MAVLGKEEIMNRLKELVGEDTSDDTLKLFEDVSDTMDELTSKNDNGEDWKEKYETLDKEWRAKYRERFFSSNVSVEEEEKKLVGESELEETETPKTFEELFEK